MASHRFANIDGLRAVAALAVFFQHIMGDLLRAPDTAGTPLAAASAISTSSIDLGRFGVVLFFLISGFVVPFSLGKDAPIRRFAVSRFFRLYPALWMALFALVVLFAIAGEPVGLSVLLANMTMAPTVLGEPWLSGIYWTLFIELLFYVLVVMLFSAGVLYRPRIVFAVTMVLLASTAGPILVQPYLPVHLPVQYVGLHLSFLLTGLMLRLALVEKAPAAARLAFVTVPVQLIATCIAGLYSIGAGDAFAELGIVPVMAAYAGAIAVFVFAAVSQRPRSAVLSYLGTISYSIYLFHWIVCTSIYHLLPFTGGWADLGTIGLCLAATLVVSAASYKLIEQPSIGLGQAVARWWLRPAAVAST